ncbi:hypothetical protein GF1_10340 [Desulfolithobacter dissulfuricans]|uniref:Serine hydroxymethyltransferase-like domain-containing protein n=1 Tax=Desulfolithobacter dissulfuricans TaxID=2795293 RepID=A0A915TZI1_9BACT|nr:hypothetical protein GF1_10340 [Desulfolithobacter dissulfuricans]
MADLEHVDPDVYRFIQYELERQTNQLELIASENIVSQAVLEAQGSIFTNKYAEGYPNRRYYGGCDYADEVESIAVRRAKEIFDAEYANVQPHSGSQANMAVYFATLKPGDKVLGMDLAHGGHLTHGASVSFSGQLFNFISYGVDRETETINMEEVERIAFENRPKMIVAGASAYPRVIDFEGFRRIADQIGPSSWWIWRTSPAWSPQGSTLHRFPMPTLSPPPLTKPCAGRAADSSWPGRNMPRVWTARFFPVSRAVPWST